MICEYCINRATHATGDLQHAICNDCRKKLVEPSDSVRLSTLGENLIQRARARIDAFQRLRRKLLKLRAKGKSNDKDAVDKLLDDALPLIEDNIYDTEIALRFDMLRQETSLTQ